MTCRRRLLPLILLLLCAALPAGAAGRWDVHQDAPRLTWLVPGFLPPDGLLTVGLRGGTYAPGYPYNDGGIGRYTVWQYGVFAHWTPLPGVAVSATQDWRSWSKYYAPPAEETGSGLADGGLRAAVAMPGLPSWLGVVAWGGANLPTGADGIGEGAVSPEAGVTAAVRVWRDSQLPEMRVHVTLGRRWNRNEDEGFGAGNAAWPQPWYPQYPDAASAGGDGDNDFMIWGVGLEFRASTTALWVEYTEQQLTNARDVVWSREDQKVFAAGLRWGLEEGWALQVDYEVGFQKDEPWFTDWYPRHSEQGYRVGVSRQFGIGGRDGDGDGIPDRRDTCPRRAEDRDGFRDEDGCPDDDNDGDGIPDIVDGAPDAPEDRDGFQDHDGVPDPDNDGDGIPDRRDACPDEAEDLDGDQDDDGCPEEFTDRDGDGVRDADDLCPSRPEDLDGFQDQDGCPDPDNDLDGIDDADDLCPDEPEDYDGDRDNDGCPDLTPEEEAARAAAAEAAEAARAAQQEAAQKAAAAAAGGDQPANTPGPAPAQAAPQKKGGDS